MFTFFYFIIISMLPYSHSLVFDLSTTDTLILSEDIIEHQIIQGSFKPLKNDTDANVTYNAIVTDENNDKIFFHSNNLPIGEETHFSFNTVEAVTVLFKMKVQRNNNDTYKNTPLKIELKIDSKFDTFNKEVAKNEKITPAMQTLTALEKLLREVHNNSIMRKNKFNQVAGQHKRLIFSVVVLSFVTLLLFIAGNAYQVMVFKKFLKQKKYI
ncbi:Emp24/gp25L/p24 family protein [Spraguea lophii 42_110]|uniref:Emp24/gp25L/p24 family protein n=1 Tax=Spraguea lophii (strain 42_110) TaxID=1358809 RepID=S7XTS5_SPRLO|nr:Emp24/gp25L/p24 family protein [Spraguea lophii 42_110]